MTCSPSVGRPFVLLTALLLCACVGACADGKKPVGARKTEPEPVARSPLGVGYPDPLATVRRVMGNMEAGKWAEACEDLADLGRNGRPVPLVPGENVPAVLDAETTRRIQPFFRHFRGVNRPWVSISYGQVENVRNDPPTIRVPVRWHYDLAKVTARDREVLIHAYKKQVGRDVTWNDVVAQMQREVATHQRNESWPTWTFSWLKEHWRLYIGRPLK